MKTLNLEIDEYISILKQNIITYQQEIALKKYRNSYKRAINGNYSMLKFWEWYWHYCYENNLYNDRASFQIDENDEE